MLFRSNGTLNYTPKLNWNGALTFAVSVSDGVDSTVSIVTVDLAPVNDAPVCTPVSIATNEDTPGSTTLNCTDVDGDTLTYALSGVSANGAARFDSASNTITFTPNLNWNGSTTIAITAFDRTPASSGLSATASVSITVAPVNDAPVCTDLTLNGTEDTTSTLSLS